MDRQKALDLWKKYNDDDYLYRHALSVEAAMRWWAVKYGEDPEYWGIVGLLHDVDYQQHPEEHLVHSADMLSSAGYSADFIHAVVRHGYGICSDVSLFTLEKVLYAADELTGFIYACAIMRPSKSLDDLEAKSVLKKFKTPAFAAKIDRTVITRGAQMLGLELSELITNTIEALKPVGLEIGLQKI